MNQKAKGIIGILTGGGDVPGLNPPSEQSPYVPYEKGIK